MDDLEARDLKEIEHVLLQDLLVAIRVHNLQNLPHHAPVLGLFHVEVEHELEEFARLLHVKPAQALLVKVVKELRDVIHSLGNLLLLHLLHTLLVVVEHDSHEDTQ